MNALAPWRLWLIRQVFHLLYNQLAWIYDAVASVVSQGQWKLWGGTALPYLRGPRVLDLGHGPGNLLPVLAQAGFDAVGYDLSPYMGRIARRRLARRGLRIPLARGLAQGLPFPDGVFHSVVCAFPSEFIVHPATLSEIGRVLASSGVLVLVPMAFLTGGGPLTRLSLWLYAITGQRPPDKACPPPHFEPAGFHSDVKWVSLPRSKVMVIVNEKRAA
jgi:ubiquinone/menaquinone biosynthesis C-methylase UbiE